MRNKRYWSFLILLTVCSHIYTQERRPIKEVFAYIGSHYNISLSYIEDDMVGITMPLPPAEATFEELIAHINEHPFLECKKVQGDAIAIKRIQKVSQICGTVKDAVTGDILIGATVEGVSHAARAITDASGSFVLNEQSVDAEVFIRYLGYRSSTVPISQFMDKGVDCTLISLQPSSLALNEVVLTNLFTTGLSKKADGSIVVSKDDFGLLPGLVASDVLQTIQVLPGVESVNESIADINIRGGSHDQNLLSWDGIKMYQSGHFFGLISAFNPQITKEVTIVKNGTSAQYTDGVSGSILMESENELQQKVKGSVGSDLLAVDALLTLPITKKMSLSITGRQSLTGFYRSPTYTKYFERSFEGSSIQSDGINRDPNFEFNDISAKLIYQFHEDHTLYLSFINLFNDLDYSEEEDAKRRESKLSQQNMGVGAQLKSEWNNRFHTNFSAYFSKYRLEALDNNITDEQSLSQENEVTEEGVKLNTFFKISDQILWLNGYDYTETGVLNASHVVNPTYQIIQKRVNGNHGLFSEITYAGNHNYLRAGIRASYLERPGRFLAEPRLSYDQELFPNVSIKAQAELKHQTTTQFVDLNEDFLGVENRRWVNSDENIPVLQSKQASLGMDYNQNGWYLEVTGFYKKVKNIVSESQGFQGQYQFDGFIGESEIVGSEFLINKRFGDQNTVWLSYTLSDQSFLFKELSPDEFPGNYNVDQSFSAGSSYYFTKNWSASLGYMWKTGRKYTQPTEGAETVREGSVTRVDYGPKNAFQLGDYSRVDISTGYNFHINGSELSINLGVLNLLGHKNTISRYYIVDPNDDQETIAITKKALGFTPNVALRVTF